MRSFARARSFKQVPTWVRVRFWLGAARETTCTSAGVFFVQQPAWNMYTYSNAHTHTCIHTYIYNMCALLRKCYGPMAEKLTAPCAGLQPHHPQLVVDTKPSCALQWSFLSESRDQKLRLCHAEGIFVRAKHCDTCPATRKARVLSAFAPCRELAPAPVTRRVALLGTVPALSALAHEHP